jgi:hypothetical protein
MKTPQILFLILFLVIILWISTSTHLLDRVSEGFQGLSPEPVIAKGVEPTRLPTEAMPNESTPGSLPFAPYGQKASIGSYPYQDPSLGPADITQIKKLNEDLRSFLVFEGVNISSSSDPAVQLPLTQLRSDSHKLQQEVSVLEKNPGIKSSMTQQDLADIDGALTFLQRKVRLFQTAGVVSNVEGFTSGSSSDQKTRATKKDILDLQTKVYAAILTLSSSGTTDAVVRARVKILQDMYISINEILTKLDKGLIIESDIPIYKEDITGILPNLAKPGVNIGDIFSQKSGKKLSPVEQQLSMLVGEDNAQKVFNGLVDKGMFRVSMDLGYNVPSMSNSTVNKKGSNIVYSKNMRLQADGTMGSEDMSSKLTGSPLREKSESTVNIDSAYDTRNPGMDDRLNMKSNKVGGLDWKKRTESICEQVRKRGLDPLDFGCIPEGSLMSPAYSWRGHAKMICGRLSSTMDPDLPRVSGCPPPGWKGWSLSY